MTQEAVAVHYRNHGNIGKTPVHLLPRHGIEVIVGSGFAVFLDKLKSC
jgi:hypothetical protein